MSIITLTTDFGHKDHFVSAIKAHCFKSYRSRQLWISRTAFRHSTTLRQRISLKMLTKTSPREVFISSG